MKHGTPCSTIFSDSDLYWTHFTGFTIDWFSINLFGLVVNFWLFKFLTFSCTKAWLLALHGELTNHEMLVLSSLICFQFRFNARPYIGPCRVKHLTDTEIRLEFNNSLFLFTNQDSYLGGSLPVESVLFKMR